MLLEENDPRSIFAVAHCKTSEAVLCGRGEAAAVMATTLTKTMIN